MGPSGATVPSWCFPGCSRSFLVLEVLNILTFPVEPLLSLVHLGHPRFIPVEPGIIVRLGLN
ncbi:hypothetical protein DPMN_168203 [Dreissena polymorpha]|uniref:Uncharacterized protein n=1 Tax=Dreissena polymorpha TaxID=45954 RepID=A0A9D4IZ30_DREPO|nr:hypothetical protein DPMN_168203 [Dreissena polymorpha]